jgi:histidine triad (HIT) family protein
MKDCIFCKVINGELPSSKIYEDELVFVFMDIQPVNTGHVLVIPKQHAEFITELDDDTAAHMIVIANKVNAAIRKSGIKTEAINYFVADGAAAGQDVFHTHLHVFPRFKNDGFGLKFSETYTQLPPREDLDDAADKIRINM